MRLYFQNFWDQNYHHEKYQIESSSNDIEYDTFRTLKNRFENHTLQIWILKFKYRIDAYWPDVPI